MKLLANARFLTRPMTGVDRVAVELLNALQALSLEEGGDVVQLAIPVDCAVDTNQALPNIPIAFKGKRRGQGWEQFELLRVDKDAWLLNLCNMGPLLRARQATMIHDAQVYLSPESYSWAFRTWYRFALPRLARRSAVLLTVSEYSKNELEQVGAFPKGKAQVIYNGVDHMDRIEADDSILVKHQLKPGDYLLALGSRAKHKNTALLLDLMRELPAEAAPLVLVGGGGLDSFVDPELVASGRVILTGRIDDASLKALYANAMLFLFPSITEGFGLPPLEAMRCGCPVLASMGGAIHEVCGDAASYADPHRPHTWAEPLQALIDSSARRNRLRQLGHAQAASFTWRQSAQQVLRLLSREGILG